jgi:hypothetical protein
MNAPRRSIRLIAADIINTWYQNRAKKYASKEPHEWRDVVYFGAVPYLEAMLTMSGDEGYGLDSTASIVLYGLSNMSSFRGPEAKALKVELKAWSVRPRGRISRGWAE